MGKLRLIRPFIAVSALFVLLAAAPAYAAPVEVFRVSTSGLTADTALYESSSCGSTTITIIPTDGRIKLSGQTEVSSALVGLYDESDYCTETFRYGSFDVPLDNSAFQIDKKLNQATLHTTVDVCGWVNFEPTCFPMNIDLTWTGEGKTFRNKDRTQELTSHYKTMYSYDSTARSAVISGSVALPWRSFTEGFYGGMSTAKTREMRVYKL